MLCFLCIQEQQFQLQQLLIQGSSIQILNLMAILVLKVQFLIILDYTVIYNSNYYIKIMLSNNKFSRLNTLKSLYQDLVCLKSDINVEGKQSIIRERLNKFSQLMIWGAKNNIEDFFDFFCQTKSLQLYHDIFIGSKILELKICAIDNISKLLINLSEQNYNNYILSTAALIKLQTIKLVNISTEVAEYYINFLKTLTQKVNNNTLEFFFNKKHPNFPLAWQTIRFFNHPQNLIRNTCRNIILGLLRLKEQRLNQYFCRFPFVIYYSHFCCSLRDFWIYLNQIIQNDKDYQQLQNQNQDHYDLLLYLEDLMNVGNEQVKKCVINGFVNEGLSFLIKCLITNNHLLNTKLIIYLLNLLFKIISNTNLLDILLIVLFGRFHNNLILKFINSESIISYKKQWSFKGFWDNFEQKIINKSAEIFEGQIPKKNTISKSKVHSVEAKSLFGIDDQKYDSELAKLEKVYGITKGQQQSNETNFEIFIEFINMINDDMSYNPKFEGNPIKTVVLDLMKSKDDERILILVIDLCIKILKNTGISKNILKFCGLLISEKYTDSYNNLTQENLSSICMEIISRSQNQCFQIQLIRCAIQLLQLLNPKIIYLKSNQYVQTISADIQILIINCYKLAINNLIDLIKTHQDNYEHILDLIEISEASTKGIFIKDIRTYGLINQNKSSKLDSIQLPEKICKIFFLVTKLRYNILNSKYSKQQIERILCPQKKIDPILAKYQPGTQIIINQKWILTTCFFKQFVSQEYSSCDLLVYANYFIVIEKTLQNKYNHGVVIIASNFKKINWIQDKQDPKKLLVNINRQEKSESITLLFNDSKALISTAVNFGTIKNGILKNQIEDFLMKLKLLKQDMIK